MGGERLRDVLHTCVTFPETEKKKGEVVGTPITELTSMSKLWASRNACMSMARCTLETEWSRAYSKIARKRGRKRFGDDHSRWQHVMHCFFASRDRRLAIAESELNGARQALYELESIHCYRNAWRFMGPIKEAELSKFLKWRESGQQAFTVIHASFAVLSMMQFVEKGFHYGHK